MTDDDYQKWVEASRRRRTSQHQGRCDMQNVTCIRVSNDRYAKDATFEDRLSLEDKQMLSDMGILL